MILYHITTQQLWEAQRLKEDFRDPSLETEGFIHASLKTQVPGTLNRFFAGKTGLCVLGFDVSKAGKIVFEDLYGEGKAFPHVYGPIPKTAIISSRFLENAVPAGSFVEALTPVHRILELVSVPSFSSFEERIHPVIVHLLTSAGDVQINRIAHNNLLIRRRSKKGFPVVVLSAHLDKINHFGALEPSVVPAFEWEHEIEGVLDDSAGLGIVLSLFLEFAEEDVDIVLALSEMEEGTGLRHHPDLLRNGGDGLHHGMGAQALAKTLLRERKKPAGFVTVDTTPFFKGKSGVAIYARHWELNRMEPVPGMPEVTASFVNALLLADPEAVELNNTNDYLEYGKALTARRLAIPCVALEPAIFPYHRKDERVYKKDIGRVMNLGREAVRLLAHGKFR
jgi:uncharacterized protein (DUF952 family)